MAGPTGFEPAISSVTGWHVGPLHHGPAGVTVPEHTRHRRALQLADSALRWATSCAAASPYAAAPRAAPRVPAR